MGVTAAAVVEVEETSAGGSEVGAVALASTLSLEEVGTASDTGAVLAGEDAAAAGEDAATAGGGAAPAEVEVVVAVAAAEAKVVEAGIADTAEVVEEAEEAEEAATEEAMAVVDTDASAVVVEAAREATAVDATEAEVEVEVAVEVEAELNEGERFPFTEGGGTSLRPRALRSLRASCGRDTGW